MHACQVQASYADACFKMLSSSFIAGKGSMEDQHVAEAAVYSML
jgi:hypothetical protein